MYFKRLELERITLRLSEEKKANVLQTFAEAMRSADQPRLVTVDGRARAGKDSLINAISKKADSDPFSMGLYSRIITWVYLRGKYKDWNDPEFIAMVEGLSITPVTGSEKKLINVRSTTENMQVLLDQTSTDPAVGLRSMNIDATVTAVSSQEKIVRSLNAMMHEKAQQAYENHRPFFSHGRDHYNIFPRSKENKGHWHHSILMLFLGVDDNQLRHRVYVEELKRLGDDVTITPKIQKLIADTQQQTLVRDYKDHHRSFGKLLSDAEANLKVRSDQYDANIDTTYLTEDQVLVAVACLYLLKHNLVTSI